MHIVEAVSSPLSSQMGDCYGLTRETGTLDHLQVLETGHDLALDAVQPVGKGQLGNPRSSIGTPDDKPEGNTDAVVDALRKCWRASMSGIQGPRSKQPDPPP